MTGCWVDVRRGDGNGFAGTDGAVTETQTRPRRQGHQALIRVPPWVMCCRTSGRVIIGASLIARG